MYGDAIGGLMAPSSDSFNRPSNESNRELSSYDLASDDSRYNDETERNSSATEDTGVQNSRVVLVQRSTLTTGLDSNAMVYIMSLLLPLVRVNNLSVPSAWMCSPSAAIRATEMCLCHLTRFYDQLRAQIRRLAYDQFARDLFATAMDIVLVVYAIGFLLLSLYQATIIG